MPQEENNYQNLIKEDIFTMMGFKDLDDNKKKELMTQMLETTYARVIGRIDSLLTDGEDKEKWIKMIDEDKKEEAKVFLQERGIDIDKLLAEEALIYKMEMVEGAKVIKNRLIEETKDQKGGDNE